MKSSAITRFLAAFTLLTTAYAATDPVLWLKFDGDVEDQSGNGSNGTLLNDTEFSADVPPALGDGSSLLLANNDAENQGVSVEGNEDLNTDAFTMTYWVNPAGPQGNAGLERLTSRGGDLFETAIGDRNAVGGADPLTLSYFAGSWESTEITLSENEWSHVAWRNNDDATLDLFVNGEKVFSGSGVEAGRIGADALLSIGTRHNEIEGFDGLMDDFRHYNVALADDEIVDLLSPALGLPPFVGAWSFDGDAKDSSGNGNDGELVDAEFSDDTPRADGGKSLLLSGGAHVLVPHAESLNITTAMSIAAWVKPVGDVEWDGVIAKNPSEDSAPNHAGNFELRIENGDRFLNFLHQQGGANDTVFQQGTESIIESDTWTHVVVTAETETGNVSFYINGLLSQTLESIITIDEFPTNESPLYIGSRADLFTGFDGLLDEVVLHNAVLDETEVDNLYVNGLRAPGDADGDGMSDDWEVSFGLNPDDPADADLDPDDDSLTSRQEFELRTNPVLSDTDADGLPDNVETKTGVWVSATDTGTSPTRPDTDRDKLLDGVETNTGIFVDETDTGSHPLVKDTDADGALDGLEVAGGFDPTDPNSVASHIFPGGFFTSRHVWSAGDAIGTIEDAESALNGDIDLQGDITVRHPYSHFHDNANAPISQDLSIPYPLWAEAEDLPDENIIAGERIGGGPADHDDFVIESTGEFFLRSGGEIRFIVNSDDGFVMWVDGEEIAAHRGNRGRNNNIDATNDNGDPSEMGIRELSAGLHTLRVVSWERGGGAGHSVYIARTGVSADDPVNEDNFELLSGFNIHDVDTEDSDGDGMDDFKENFFFGDLSKDGSGDEDGDGLADALELTNRVDPTVKDSDGDGVEDGPEVNTHGSNPALVDSDGDTLTDGDEVNIHGTSPATADTDEDGSGDAIELAFNTDPNNGAERPNAVAATQSGDWNDASIWEDGLAPSAGKNYVVLSGIVSQISATQGAFGGDSLTLLGSTLELTAAESQADLVVANGIIAASRNANLGGKLNISESTTIDAGNNELNLGSQLSGTGTIAFRGGSVDVPAGSVGISGPASSFVGDFSVIGTSLFLFTENGLAGAGQGNLTLQGAELHVTVPSTFCGDILIIGDAFVLNLGSTLEIADLKGIDPESGSVLFSLQTLVPNAELTATNLIEDIRFNPDQAIGEGTLTLNDDPTCSLPGCDDPSLDTDDDGLSDCDEALVYATGINNPDTDGDGLQDGAEIAGGTNPLSEDTDRDGLLDGEDPNPTVSDRPAGTSVIVNGSFEEPVLANINTNNLGTVPTGWSQTGDSATWNLIRNDGSAYGSGVDNAADGAQIIDLNGLFELFQSFTLSDVTTLRFGASFANREAHDGSAPSTFGIYDATGTELLSEEVSVDTSADPTPSDEWRSGEAFVTLPAGEYQIRIALNNFNNIDAVAVDAISAGGGDVGRPTVIDSVFAGPSSLGLSFLGGAGETYAIEYSQDLQTWTTLETGLSGNVNYEDTDATRQGRVGGYYRAVQE